MMKITLPMGSGPQLIYVGPCRVVGVELQTVPDPELDIGGDPVELWLQEADTIYKLKRIPTVYSRNLADFAEATDSPDLSFIKGVVGTLHCVRARHAQPYEGNPQLFALTLKPYA